jgi:transcriptional regulator with XRE-family HTH domain
MDRVKFMPKQKEDNAIDAHVGGRVRLRRLQMQMTQEKLGHALGLTFQQVQKYENGMNRISASRLQAISGILEAPIPWFFEDAPQVGRRRSVHWPAPSADFVTDFIASSEGLALSKAFVKIKDPKVKSRIVGLVKAMSGESEN